jgi:hypothetical protein
MHSVGLLRACLAVSYMTGTHGCSHHQQEVASSKGGQGQLQGVACAGRGGSTRHFRQPGWKGHRVHTEG